jgi:hypothetical protein
MHDEMKPPRGGVGPVARIMTLMLAMLVMPLSALAQTSGAPKGNPRLSSLSIEIWPEYDRPAALVILRGALAEGVPLPAMITLRLPAASGGPAAVAHSAAADGNLLNLKYERASAGEFITLKFETPQRFFHVEFYEPIATTTPARSFSYVWPGDLAVDRVTVVVQEPALASAVSVDPKLDGISTGQDGLQYRAGELGALASGKPLSVAVRYTKSDPRPTAEIVKPATMASAPVASAPSPAPGPAATPAAARSGLPDWAPVLAGFLLFSALGVVFIVWLWRRDSPMSASPRPYCTKCGAEQVQGNRFCGKCGAKLA